MKQTLLFFAFALALCLEAQAQVNNIVLNAGVAYTNGAPTFRPGGKGSRIAIDTVTWIWYESLDNNTGNWIESGYRVQPISGCSHPAYTPNKHQSVLVINGCDSLYYYRAGAWRHINPGGVSGVAWGDITGDITNQIDLQTALSDKADAAHNHALSDVLQSGATSGQVPKWNGSAWVPATDDNTGTTYTAGTGIAISGGNVISNTGDLSNTNEIQTVSFNSATGNLSISGGNSASLDGRYLQSEVDGSVTNEIELPSQTGNSGKYLTTNGTAPSWATVSGGSATDLSISGTSSPLTLNSSTGTDVTITAGTGISLAGSASNVTINNTGVTGSGVDGRVALWNGASSLYNSGYLTWDDANKKLTVSRILAINTATGGFQFDNDGAVQRMFSGNQFSVQSNSTSGFQFRVMNQINGSFTSGSIFIVNSGVTNNATNDIFGQNISTYFTNTSGTAKVGALLLTPRYDVSGTFAGKCVGIYYNPIVGSLNGVRNLGMELVTGDISVDAGAITVGTSAAATAKVDIVGSTGYGQLRLRTTYTPTSTADANGNTGDFSWDDNYIYIKTSAGWKRAALSTF